MENNIQKDFRLGRIQKGDSYKMLTDLQSKLMRKLIDAQAKDEDNVENIQIAIDALSFSCDEIFLKQRDFGSCHFLNFRNKVFNFLNLGPEKYSHFAEEVLTTNTMSDLINLSEKFEGKFLDKYKELIEENQRTAMHILKDIGDTFHNINNIALKYDFPMIYDIYSNSKENAYDFFKVRDYMSSYSYDAIKSVGIFYEQTKGLDIAKSHQQVIIDNSFYRSNIHEVSNKEFKQELEKLVNAISEVNEVQKDIDSFKNSDDSRYLSILQKEKNERIKDFENIAQEIMNNPKVFGEFKKWVDVCKEKSIDELSHFSTAERGAIANFEKIVTKKELDKLINKNNDHVKE